MLGKDKPCRTKRRSGGKPCPSKETGRDQPCPYKRTSRGDYEMPVKPIPEGYHSVTPYLIVRGGAAAIDFYTKAFGAVELFRFPAPDGKIGHAEIKIGDSPIMLADEYPDMGYKSPLTIGGSPVSLMIYVDDVDSVFNRAVESGATVKEALP